MPMSPLKHRLNDSVEIMPNLCEVYPGDCRVYLNWNDFSNHRLPEGRATNFLHNRVPEEATLNLMAILVFGL